MSTGACSLASWDAAPSDASACCPACALGPERSAAAARVFSVSCLACRVACGGVKDVVDVMEDAELMQLRVGLGGAG